MDFFDLLVKTVILRPYVFIFLTVFLLVAVRLTGWQRTGYFMVITWVVAFLCEFSSTRTGIPFGWYFYTGTTIGQELYIADVPFMDSLSFVFLLFASYCMALAFILPASRSAQDTAGRRIGFVRMRFSLAARTGWPVVVLTTIFFTFIDIIIDPVTIRGDRWFLGKLYYYPDPGIHFGIPVANYIGWATVSLLSLLVYLPADRKLSARPGQHHADGRSVTRWVLMGCGLYYGVLVFNLVVTFWIGEALQGMTGLLIYLPLTVLLVLRVLGQLPASEPER